MNDARMQVVLGLLPADAVFIVRRGYVVDADSDSPTQVDALLWRPKYLVGAIQDGTPLAVLIDEIVRLRAALIERGHTDECYSGMVEECDCPLRVLGKLPKEQA